MLASGHKNVKIGLSRGWPKFKQAANLWIHIPGGQNFIWLTMQPNCQQGKLCGSIVYPSPIFMIGLDFLQSVEYVSFF